MLTCMHILTDADIACMLTHTLVCSLTHMCIHILTCVHTCIHVQPRVHISACLHFQAHSYKCTSSHGHTQTRHHIGTLSYMYVYHIYAVMCMHTCMRTYIGTRAQIHWSHIHTCPRSPIYTLSHMHASPYMQPSCIHMHPPHRYMYTYRPMVTHIYTITHAQTLSIHMCTCMHTVIYAHKQ